MARRRVTQSAPKLQRETIVQAALVVLDREGLSNLTLRRVATELDVQAPAIYWYFKDKTELIDHMAEAILAENFADARPRDPDTPWEEWLIESMKELRTAMWSHKDGARIVAGAHLLPAKMLAKLFDISLQSLTSAGIPLGIADILIGTVVHFVFGRVIEEQAGPTPEMVQNFRLEEMFEEYPLFIKSARENYPHPEFGDEFEESLRIIIDGAIQRYHLNKMI
jgi:TetR/AcrR family tetracycline transcriptional repressor